MKKNKEEKLHTRLHEFHYDENQNLYLLPEPLKFTQDISNISPYSEDFQRLEDEMIISHQLATYRTNIIECFNFPSNNAILEFSSGSGTISRYLGKYFKSVDCIECSYLRAKSIQEHTRTLKNVKIFHSNIGWIYFEPSYDIVILIGILENAPYYFPNCPNPFIALLKTAKSALKRNGLMLLAVNNKLGIKYRDKYLKYYTGTPYDSINEYPKRETPIGFSKAEIEALLRESGFDHVSFFYCYPDYKFATEIFSGLGSEKELHLHNWINFPLGFALRTLSNAGVMREHANSFIVIATNGSLSILESDWVIKKFSKNRCKEYQCITTLQLIPRPQIVKSRLYNLFYSNKELIIGNSTFELTHQISNSQWIKGDLLLYDLYKAFSQDNFIGAITKMLKEYYEQMMKQFFIGEQDEEGFPLLNGDSLDFIFRNIIRDETGNLAPIDLEWVVDGDIPADYIVYRCIFHDINTVMRFQFPNRILSLNDFCIHLLKTIFPNYGSHRQSMNIQNELNFQKKILPPN